MPDEVLLRVKRGEGCDCYVIAPCGEEACLMTEIGVRECTHGSTVEAPPVRVVECDWCGGIGAWIGLNGDPDPANPCEHCLGTGLRLAAKDEPCGLPDGSVNYG